MRLRRTKLARVGANSERFDPYTEFKIRVPWDGRHVAGASKMSALNRATEVLEGREEDDPSVVGRPAGQTKCEAVSLERGLTHDPEFLHWASKGCSTSSERSLRDARKDVIIEIFNEAGQLALAYKLFRCWVSEFQGLPELQACDNGVAVETLTMENDGWERSYEAAEALG